MKKMLILASLLVMSLGVSPSFATSPVVSNAEAYITVITCIDKSNTPVLDISVSAVDLKNLPQARPFKSEVIAIIAGRSKTGGLNVILAKGKLIFSNALSFISNFDVQLNLKDTRVAIHVNTGHSNPQSSITFSETVGKSTATVTAYLVCTGLNKI